MALALIALLTALGSGYAALLWRGTPETRKRAGIAAGVAGAALIASVLLWITRPGLAAIEDRVAAAMEQGDGEAGTAADPSIAADGALICTLVPERSRVTAARTDDVAFDWAADGCVNTRTQYGQVAGGEWSRVMVVEDDAAVAVNTYDPATRTFRSDRYLLGKAAMDKVLAVRGKYSPPACGVTEAARKLGEQQSALVALLPDSPNERLVYSCGPKAGGARELAAP
jgi:serine protease Do